MLGDERALRHRRQPQLSRSPSSARASHALGISACGTKSSTPAELERDEYRANPVNRCYYCKHELYTTLSRIARARGFATIVDGSNADDRGDYRPGRAAAREFGVRSPLDDVGLTKDRHSRAGAQGGSGHLG